MLEVAEQLRKIARALAELERQDCGVDGTEQLRRDLLQQAKRMTDANIPVGRVGYLSFGSQRELGGKKDVAKRIVVLLFLLGCGMWWSSCMKRDGTDEASLKKHQAGLMLFFDEAKRNVHTRYIPS